MKTFIKSHPIASFLVINYLISWSFLYPSYQLILENDGITPLALFGLIGAYGPSIAAIIVQHIVDKNRLRDLFQKLVQIKHGFKVYMVAMGMPIFMYIFAYSIAALLMGGNLSPYIKVGILGIPGWLLLALPFGPMGEELGWRGFMLPRLLEKYSVTQSTVLVGLAWGVWHLASFTFPGAAIPSFLPVNAWTILLYFVNTVALSSVFTYLHFTGRGSVFLAILLHCSFNAAASITFDFYGSSVSESLQLATYIANIVVAGSVGFYLLRGLETEL
jgi:membrane protease YdiL (CAAX protease family)